MSVAPSWHSGLRHDLPPGLQLSLSDNKPVPRFARNEQSRETNTKHASFFRQVAGVTRPGRGKGRPGNGVAPTGIRSEPQKGSAKSEKREAEERQEMRSDARRKCLVAKPVHAHKQTHTSIFMFVSIYTYTHKQTHTHTYRNSHTNMYAYK